MSCSGLIGPAYVSKPGFAPARIARLMREAVERVTLDLRGMTVLTEAATGAYGVTAPMAAMAGAKHVFAVARGSRYGTAEQAATWTLKLASLVGVEKNISISQLAPDNVESIDLVTNSGHLRPIGSPLVSRLHATAVIALMYEAWELRESDIDVAACRERSIRIVGVNERHPTVDVFPYLGTLCVFQLQCEGFPVYGSNVAVLCDNDFGAFIVGALRGLGAVATLFTGADALPAGDWDCIVIALRPRREVRVGAREAAILARNAPNALIAQIWGDVDRTVLAEHRLCVSPSEAVKPGHMAVLLSDLGPDPIVRLQSGGLRAAEFVLRGGTVTSDSIAQLV